MEGGSPPPLGDGTLYVDPVTGRAVGREELLLLLSWGETAEERDRTMEEFVAYLFEVEKRFPDLFGPDTLKSGKSGGSAERNH